MVKLEILEDKVKENNGFISTAELSEIGFDYRKIQKLIRENTLEKVKNGLYRHIGFELNEKDYVINLFPDGVLCMESALYYYGYLDHPPIDWNVAVDKDTSKSRFKVDYPYFKPYYMEADQLMLGAEAKAFGSGSMLIYNKERLICDCLKYESKMDRDIYNMAIRKYIADSDKNSNLLYEYAAKRRIYKKARDVLGIWI